jgi:hypothetical protein
LALSILTYHYQLRLIACGGDGAQTLRRSTLSSDTNTKISRAETWTARPAFRHAALLIVIALIFSHIPAASAATSRSTSKTILRGVITDTSGNHIAGATVVLQTVDGKIIASTSTDGHGQFMFKRNRLEDYIIVANKPGYSTSALTVPENGAEPLVVSIEPQSQGTGVEGGM